MSASGGPQRVAVVIDDDPDIRQLLATVLQQAGFEVHQRGNGEDGIAAVVEVNPVVTTLDVNMPGIDGFETAKRIRAVSDTYIVMLSALADEIDTLQGLEAGADDYVTKPFRPRELRARIEAMLRRPRNGAVAAPAAESGTATPPAAAGWFAHRDLRLQPQTRVVEVEDIEITLTRSEFDLLHALLAARRRVLSKSELARVLHGDLYGASSYVGDADERAIEVHMANLRRKLGDSSTDPRWIETVRGVGYRLTSE